MIDDQSSKHNSSHRQPHLNSNYSSLPQYNSAVYLEQSRRKSSRNWRDCLHPEVQQIYDKIMRGQKVNWRAGKYSEREEKLKDTTEQESGFLHSKKEYEQKISLLQEQNNSLKEELYYLREALLINLKGAKEQK